MGCVGDNKAPERSQKFESQPIVFLEVTSDGFDRLLANEPIPGRVRNSDTGQGGEPPHLVSDDGSRGQQSQCGSPLLDP